jgi:hypothetical protein
LFWRIVVGAFTILAYYRTFRWWRRSESVEMLSREGCLRFMTVQWRGLSAGREFFTEDGWRARLRYKRWGLVAFLGAFMSIALSVIE